MPELGEKPAQRGTEGFQSQFGIVLHEGEDPVNKAFLFSIKVGVSSPLLIGAEYMRIVVKEVCAEGL
jgi:hypothetical protein